VLAIPQGMLEPGGYRLSVRGGGGGALADLSANTLGEDYSLEVNVGSSR
jgi:hypothetical protein